MELESNTKTMDKEPIPSGTSIKQLRWYEVETKIVWFPNVLIDILLHTGSLYYFITFPYLTHKFLVLWAILMFHITFVGITAGAHRLWAHRSFKAKLPLRILLATLYYASGMNRILSWTRDHRVHHKYSDTEADPHNSTRGFWFSHNGWLMMKKNDKVLKAGRGIDVSDIAQDPVVKFFDGHHLIMRILLTVIIPVFIPVYFFNQDLKLALISQIFMRFTLTLNAASAVNSFNHMFGYRSYDKSIPPTENIFTAFLTNGEGWHNYHHLFPWDYKAAEFKSFFFNSTTFYIDMFAKIGWAYDLKSVEPAQIQKVIEKKGDGTHHTVIST